MSTIYFLYITDSHEPSLAEMRYYADHLIRINPHFPREVQSIPLEAALPLFMGSLPLKFFTPERCRTSLCFTNAPSIIGNAILVVLRPETNPEFLFYREKKELYTTFSLITRF